MDASDDSEHAADCEIGTLANHSNITCHNEKPVKIIYKTDDTFALDENTLIQILNRPDVIDHKIVVISVAGEFRKGKSFLLNFFLRYLKYDGDQENWMKDETIPLLGFSWCGGSERHTDGIWLWNEPFFATMDSGEEVAILLMDTQGTFDSQSTVKENAAIFALSNLIASVQIYNISQNIQEDHLQNLQLFTAYGEFALDDLDSTPFQNQGQQHKELKQVRQYIHQSFSKLHCFLMPHPGLEIIEKKPKEFLGQLSKIRFEFKEHMGIFIQTVLSEYLCPKIVNGKAITAGELIQYFRSYVNVFNSGDLPTPRSVFMATAKANHMAACSKAKNEYVRNMQDLFKPELRSLTDEKLLYFHKLHEGGALKMFREIKKMGTTNHEFTRKYYDRLKLEIENEDKIFQITNKTKRQREWFWLRFGQATCETVQKVGHYIYERRDNIICAIGTGAAFVVGAFAGRRGGMLGNLVRIMYEFLFPHCFMHLFTLCLNKV